jgi:hypothetical protein
MRDTGLVLFEGIPGSGKSTSSHHLRLRLAELGIAAEWWQEENPRHPVYAFDDAASLRRLLDDLAAGGHAAVIERALARWRAFVAARVGSPTVTILDSCLLGYLTWTLFPHFDVPEPVVLGYVDRVVATIAPLRPCLVHFAHPDVAAGLRRVVERRYVDRAVGSPFGRRHGLAGFDGLVAYWTASRELGRTALARVPFPTLAVDNAAGDWPAYDRAIAEFLDLPPSAARKHPRDLSQLTGTYHQRDVEAPASCEVRLDDGDLVVLGLPGVWPRTRLIPAGDHRFHAESWPFEVEFLAAIDGTGLTMRVGDHRWGTSERVFVREATSEPG